MGNKINRGQPKVVPMSVKLQQQKNAEEEKRAEKKAFWDKKMLEKKQAQEKKLTEKKLIEENAKKVAATMNFEYIHPHYALTLKQNGENRQLVISLNFIADPPTDMLSLMKILPEYAPGITNVRINLLAPAQHGSRAIYHQRVENMNKLVEHLNSFPLTELDIMVDMDNHDSFQQLKLAAAFNGLNFQDWTLGYQIMGSHDYHPIENFSPYEKRLRGVYRAEFGAQ